MLMQNRRITVKPVRPAARTLTRLEDLSACLDPTIQRPQRLLSTAEKIITLVRAHCGSPETETEDARKDPGGRRGGPVVEGIEPSTPSWATAPCGHLRPRRLAGSLQLPGLRRPPSHRA